MIVVPGGGAYVAMDQEDECSEHALLPFTFGQVMPGLQDIDLVANFGQVEDEGVDIFHEQNIFWL